MNEKTAKLIRDELLGNNNSNKEINYNLNLEEHFKTYTDEDLTKNIYISLYQSKGIEAITDTDIGKTKKAKINYILNNLEMLVKNYLEMIPEYRFIQYKKLINMDGKASFDLSKEMTFSISFLLDIKNSIFGKVYYKDDVATIYIQKDINNIMTKLIQDKEVIKENKFNNKIYNFVRKITYTYGILTYEEVYKMFIKYNNSKIDEDKFRKIVFEYQFVEDDYVIHNNNTNDEVLICNVEFYEQEDTLKFYDKLSSKLNNKLTLKDIENIADSTYFHKFSEYKELVKFLENNFEITEFDLENIDKFVIDEFITNAQLSLDNAISNYRRNIKDQFELNSMEEDKILNYLKEIYEKMPKWSKRGNI